MLATNPVATQNLSEIRTILKQPKTLVRWWSELADNERGALLVLSKIPRDEWSKDWGALSAPARNKIAATINRLAVIRGNYLAAVKAAE